MTYRIICDSCTDMSEDMLRLPCVSKVPLSIQVGTDTIIDGENFVQADLLSKMRAWPDAPKTACPSPDAFMECFCDDGDNYIVTLSGKLSGSYNAAVQARDIYKDEGGKGNVYVFDSMSASAGQTQVMLLIHELVSKNTPFAQVVEFVNAYINRLQTLFVLENLDNLRKNGRLTKVQSLVTGALRGKLLMSSNGHGEIQKIGQGLSMKQTLARMTACMADNAEHAGRRLVLAHCNCLDRAEYVKDLAMQRCRFSEILIVNTGGISTVYANDGGIVAAY
ncbi:MAG: DegV family protein [Oscillospiraceae bacterium]|nr:DegV family protein [Oscillospiraceae bacterium]